MEIYQTEEEQVEAIKRWWDKNGKKALTLIAIVLLSVVASQQWVKSQQSKIESAAELYSQMLNAYDQDWGQSQEMGRSIIAGYSGSHYAVLSSLMLAKGFVEHGDLGAAETHLNWVVVNAKDETHQLLAKIRLARVNLAQNRPDDALALVNAIKDSEFSALVNEVKGDIYLQKGDRTQARDAYAQALSGYASLPQKRSVVQMKLDDLAEASTL